MVKILLALALALLAVVFVSAWQRTSRERDAAPRSAVPAMEAEPATRQVDRGYRRRRVPIEDPAPLAPVVGQDPVPPADDGVLPFAIDADGLDDADMREEVRSLNYSASLRFNIGALAGLDIELRVAERAASLCECFPRLCAEYLSEDTAEGKTERARELVRSARDLRKTLQEAPYRAISARIELLREAHGSVLDYLERVRTYSIADVIGVKPQLLLPADAEDALPAEIVSAMYSLGARAWNIDRAEIDVAQQELDELCWLTHCGWENEMARSMTEFQQLALHLARELEPYVPSDVHPGSHFSDWNRDTNPQNDLPRYHCE